MSSQLDKLLANVNAQASSFNKNDYGAQMALIQSVRDLLTALEPPAVRVARMAYYEPLLGMAVRMALEVNLFELIVKNGGDAQSASSLAEATKVDPILLQRVLKQLATAQLVTETGADQYASNELTQAFATRGAKGTMINTFDPVSLCNGGALIEYMKAHNWVNPIDKNDSPWQYSMNTKQHYFEWLFAPGNEQEAMYFQDHMAFKTLGPKWFETVPVEEVLGQPDGKDPEAVTFVDVGGAQGHDILQFRKVFPQIKGRFILQDLPPAINQVDPASMDGIEPMVYDFFTPEPIIGARAYYMKMVLHDWPDTSCKEILTNLKGALVKGHSKILINEIVIPEVGAGWFETSVDLLMMVAHAATERREQAWRDLIESVGGLKVTKIWDCGGVPEKLIEVELA